jgi:hypothetical protein
MRWRDFWIIWFCFLSLLFTILTIIPGGQKGILPAVSIATVSTPSFAQTKNSHILFAVFR